MKTTASLFSFALITTGIASAATVQTSQTIEISGAGWNSALFAGGTFSATNYQGGPFTPSVSASLNSTSSVANGAGFDMISNVSSSFSSIIVGISDLRNTATHQDRVAWFEIDITGFDIGEGNLSSFMGVSSFGVQVLNDTGLNYTASGGIVGYGSTITPGVDGATATLRFTSFAGMPFGAASQRSATMSWNHTETGADLRISAVRIGIETLETVPEPSAPALGAPGLIPLLRRRRN